MQTLKVILRHLSRPATLAVMGLLLLTSAGKAVTMEMWVKARGTTWAIVVPGSNTGGRLVWNASRGAYVTDRVSRGESMEVDFYTSTSAEKTNSTVVRCWLSSAAGQFNLPLAWPRMDTYTWLKVPTSPAWDNNYVNVQTPFRTWSTRIPVGTRP